MGSSDDEIAIFTRNHREYLDDACMLAPAQPVTFQASKRWVSAARALTERKPLPLYIAAIGGDGRVEYVADLHDIHLDPETRQPRTKELRLHSLKATRDEGVWSEGEGTLYLVRRCRKLARPFHLSELVKISNGKRLSGEYSYSYCLVRTHMVADAGNPCRKA